MHLTELIERVEKATGPDLHLSMDILEAMGLGVRPSTAPVDIIASLDAVLFLVEKLLPGWRRSLHEQPVGGWEATVFSPWDESKISDAYIDSHDTPALAMLLSFLRALAALKSSPKEE